MSGEVLDYRCGVPVDAGLAAKFAVLVPNLDEPQRRLLFGAEALAIGRGGISQVAAAAGMSVPTVRGSG